MELANSEFRWDKWRALLLDLVVVSLGCSRDKAVEVAGLPVLAIHITSVTGCACNTSLTRIACIVINGGDPGFVHATFVGRIVIREELHGNSTEF